MKQTLTTIFEELRETLAAQPQKLVTWTPEIVVVESKASATQPKSWWVRCDGPHAILSSKAISLLTEHNIVLNNGTPVKKKVGVKTTLCWQLNVDNLEAALAQKSFETTKLQIMERKTKALEQQLRELQSANASSHAMTQLMQTLDTLFKTKGAPKGTKFVRRKLPRGKSLGGVPSLLLSDWHYGEVVDPLQIEGLNEYNLSIAKERANRVFNTALELLLHHQSGVVYDGMVCALGGDMVSGTILEELIATNEMPITECILSVADDLSSGILELADNFPGLYVPAVSGNHGRIGKKPAAKGSAKDNYDWFLYQLVSRLVQGRLGSNCNVTFDISDSLDKRYRVYGTNYLLTHGDQIRESTSNSSFWGAMTDVTRRKQERALHSGGEGFDYLACGHFHKYGAVANMIVNGSLKGYDEYAYSRNFTCERAIQAMWVTHPDHKVISHIPIYADAPEIDSTHHLPPISFGPAMARGR